MLTAFVLIQVGINLALLIGLGRLLREREAIGRQAQQREERLESLAAELCALGRDVARHERSAQASPPTPAGTSTASRQGPTTGEESVAGTGGRGVSADADRFQGAVCLLRRGVPIETVAAETALLEGEVQVLRNLARAPGPTAGFDRDRRTRASSRKSPASAARRGAGVEGGTALVGR